MPRYFHPSVIGESVDTTAVKPFTDRQSGRKYTAVVVPPAFRQSLGALIECPIGSLAFAMPEIGRGFLVVKPGEFVDIPDTVPVETVREIAPHLVTEERKAAWEAKQDAGRTAPARTDSAPGNPPRGESPKQNR